MLTIGLSLIFIVVLVGPFLNKKIESNLEAFLFLMGVISATFSNAWSTEVIHEGFIAPINITLAVLGAGVLFHYLRKYIDHAMRRVLITVPLSVIVCTGIIILGPRVEHNFSDHCGAVASRIHHRVAAAPPRRVNLTIIACFAIGLGAALTPLGEPLSTIVVSKLSGAPYHADFLLFVQSCSRFYVVPAVIVLGIAGIFLVQEAPEDTEESLAPRKRKTSSARYSFSAGKVYIFVMALIFLGAGFKPLIDAYLHQAPVANSILGEHGIGDPRQRHAWRRRKSARR